VIPLNPDLETLVPRVVRAYDEPFADPSALPTFAVAEAAAQEVRVVLNGEGADELFAGYRRSQAAWRMQKMSAKLSWIPDGLTSQLHRLLPRPKGFRTPYSLGYRFISGLGLGLGERYITWSTDGFTEDEKQNLYSDPEQTVATQCFLDEEYDWLEAQGDLDRFMALDLVVGMGDCLLVKMDIATMASSLEARCPFLDHRMMEWAASLPREVVFKGGDTKPILRGLAKSFLPREIVSAPKRGFEIPLADWVGGPLEDMIRESLQSSSLIVELFRPEVLKNFLKENESGADRERRAKLLWILFMLSQWDIEMKNS
jgi:asparagine synthase (glutamine-hydrolysing)